jgi:predicted ArsR family transcriptional regulator
MRIPETAVVSKGYPRRPGYKERTTSRDAAHAVAPRAKTLRAAVLAALKAVAPNGLTADEIAARLGEDRHSVRPRVSELHAAGLVEAAPARRRNASGLSARVWRVAEGAAR